MYAMYSTNWTAARTAFGIISRVPRDTINSSVRSNRDFACLNTAYITGRGEDNNYSHRGMVRAGLRYFWYFRGPERTANIQTFEFPSARTCLLYRILYATYYRQYAHAARRIYIVFYSHLTWTARGVVVITLSRTKIY